MPAPAPTPMTCSVIELRRYTLHPGARETLVELFDRELVEPQEAVGMAVLGQFRDLADPDAFVWLRGFADMAARRRGLEAFYGGPVWRRHREAANATMLAWDDVLLLRPTRPWVHRPERREGRGSPAGGEASDEAVIAAVHPVTGGDGAALAAQLEAATHPRPLLAGSTERATNDFPALSVREADVCVTLALRTSDPTPSAPDGLGAPDVAVLTPTPRSALP